MQVIKSDREYPDLVVILKEGYDTIWTVKVKHTFWKFTWYINHEVNSSHSPEEAIQNYLKQHQGVGFDFITKENNPEYFL